jgi:hypothetical protein
MTSRHRCAQRRLVMLNDAWLVILSEAKDLVAGDPAAAR